jgi:gamma-glutamyl phosphate reductase
MMMLATTESKEEILLVMNNMLRRVRQGIMIPNAQESFAKKTPALSYYTLTKLHMTKSPE